MGQASRTTKLLLDVGKRTRGGANIEKRAALAATAAVLTAARAFYIDFFLAHADKLSQRVSYYSQEHLEWRERLMSAHELLTWAESCTVETAAHPSPWTGWNFTKAFPGMPFAYRRSVIKDAIGKVRSYLSNHANWERSGKKQGKPGWPAATDHPTLYQGCIQLELEALDLKAAFVRINVYTAEGWRWMHYPVNSSHYTLERLKETDWQRQSPTLVLRAHRAELHIPQVKKIEARKVMERRQDPDLVTVGVDLNVKNLAVITVRQHGKIIKTVFVTDHGLDAHRYRHLKKIAKKQWQSGRPVKGEHSNQQLWRHVDRQNQDAAHKVARQLSWLSLAGYALAQDQAGQGQQIAAHEPQAGQPITRQNQSAGKGQSVPSPGRHRGGQCTLDIPILLQMRRKGGEVLLPERPTHRSEMGQSLLLSSVSLRGQCRL
jgi:hypothetical protein